MCQQWVYDLDHASDSPTAHHEPEIDELEHTSDISECCEHPIRINGTCSGCGRWARIKGSVMLSDLNQNNGPTGHGDICYSDADNGL